ncbi:MAG: ABC transporter permease [Reyranella sp.]|uniref:ABC transporter permease n=1 Tax=Reyranella sp. TaxID=1929291 RepID=UPI003D10BD0D
MTVVDMRPSWQSWDAGLQTHLRVVSALVRREMRARGGESRLGYLWALIEPGLHLIAYMLVFSYLLKRHAPIGHNTALFLLTGIVPYFLFSKMAIYVSGAVGGNRSLLTLPPVKLPDVIAARVVLEATTYLFVGSLMFLALYLGGVSEAIPRDPLAVAEACAVAVCFGLAVGVINIVLVSFFHNWMTIYSLFNFPLWFFSGIWFLPEQVPQPYRDYLLYNPIMHILLWFRTGFYRDFKAVYLDPAYVIGVTAVALTIGLALMRVARRKVLEPT